jgi:hypothetical protein
MINKQAKAENKFSNAFYEGNLEECKNLSKEFIINDFNFFNRGLLHCCRNENLNMCRWLIENFNLSKSNVRKEILDECFRVVSSNGNIDIFKILCYHFGNPENASKVLYYATIHESFNFVIFMFEEKIVDKSNIEYMYSDESDIWLTDSNYEKLLKICEECSQIGSLTKAAVVSRFSS